MSDISLNLDGVVAFLVAAALGCCLLLGVIACALYAWSRAQRTKVGITAQPIFPHIMGMLLSLVGCLVVVLIIFIRDGRLQPHDLELWLDKWIPLWATALLLLWPISAVTLKKWRQPKRQIKHNQT